MQKFAKTSKLTPSHDCNLNFETVPSILFFIVLKIHRLIIRSVSKANHGYISKTVPTKKLKIISSIS